MGYIRDMKSENISEEISEADEELNWAAKLGYTISTNRLRELVAEISRRNARNKALDEASEVAARYGDFVVAAEIKALKEQPQ